MKHLTISSAIFLCIIIFFTNSGFTQSHLGKKIGELQGDKYIVTCNQDQLFNELEGLVSANSDVSVRFDKLSIEEGDGYYYLLAVDNDNNIKTARELVLEKGDFYEFLPEESSVSETVTCSGCNIGCNPMKLNGHWVCYPSCSPGTCTKTVTNTTTTTTEPDQE